MIVAKTKMKKIPDSCNKCGLKTYSFEGTRCFITGKVCPMEKSEHGNWRYTHPNWCPLIEVKD